MEPETTFDSIVIGGGPAGLSAALLLGRCRRSVAVFDEGRPRNEMSDVVHGYLGARNLSPTELLSLGRAQLARYPKVLLFRQRVRDARRANDLFTVQLDNGAGFSSRSLIVATGLIDRLPAIEGIDLLYGKSVFPCPYCDGWENADRKLGALGSGSDAAELALELRLWSEEVSLFLPGPLKDSKLKETLERSAIRVHEIPATAVESQDGHLSDVLLSNGSTVPCEALFLVATQVQHHDFMEKMGCRLTDSDQVECDDSGRTAMPGLFVAGNAKKGLQMAMIAAADGIKCAAAANEWLLQQDLSGRARYER